MITQENNTTYINYIILALVVVASGFGIPDLLSTLQLLDALIGLSGLVMLTAVALVAHHDSQQNHWVGIIRLSLVTGWVIFSLAGSIVILFLGTLLGFAYVYFWASTTNDRTQIIAKFLSATANNGASIFCLHVIYSILNGTFPLLNSSGQYNSAIILAIALLGCSLISIGLLVLQKTLRPDDLIANSHTFFVTEALVLIAGFALPVVYFQLNTLIFVAILILIAIQFVRQIEIQKSEVQLQEQMREMSTINKLGATIASRLSLVSALESVYQELNSLLEPTSVYIALYDEDQSTLDYQLAIVDGKRIQLEKEVISSGLTQYVINEKQAGRFTRDEFRRKLKNLYDVSIFPDEQVMIAPLQVSTKVIGVLSVSHNSKSDAFSEHDFTLFQTIIGQASLAIRNAMLYDRTVRLADNLSIINQSLQDVMFNLDRADALKTACQIAASVTSAPKAAIFLLEPTLDNQMKLVEAIGFSHISFVETVDYQPALYTKGARVFNDISRATEPDIIKLAQYGDFKACVQIPLRSGNTIVGTLNVYHNTPHYYDAPELNLLEMLTNQITAALDNADLLQALELYAAEQAELVHLSRISGGTLDLERITQDVCTKLAQMMNVSRVEIGLWNAEKRSLLLETTDGTAFDMYTTEMTVDAIPELDALMSTTGIATLHIYDEDSESLSDGLRAYMREHGDRTLGMIPMRLNSEIVGLIVLGNTKKRDFSDNDFRLLEMANHQVTVQIHNARVHTQTEAQLVNRLEQLALIEEISQHISEALELDIIIENVLEASLQSTQADFAAIALVDSDSPKRYDILWREVVDDQLIPHRMTLQLEESVVGHVAQTGEMLILPDNMAFDDYFPPTNAQRDYRSSLAVPMLTGNKVVGVLNIESAQEDFFTVEQGNYLKSLAGHAAISIDNANLLIERERQINILTLLRELSLDALSVISPDDIFDAVLRTALILMAGDETALYRFDELTGNIELIRSLRSDNGQIVDFEPTIPRSLLQDVVANGTLKLITDVQDLTAYSDITSDETPTHQSLILMPVARRKQIQEILMVGFSEARNFNHNDLNIIDMLAVQVAGHLENASLNNTITTSNDRMRAILDSTRDGIILLGSDERIQDANTSASELTGINLQDYLLQPLANIAYLAPHTEHSAKVWHDIVEQYHKLPEALHNREFTFDHDDVPVHIKLLLNSVLDEDKSIVGRLLILRDITEEKKLQDFRETMQSMVLHDLRGPLTAIVTSMYVAENILALYDGDFEELTDSLNKTFNVSLNSAEDMLRQVDTLRDLPMMNQMQVEPQEIPMYDIAETAYNSLSANFTDSLIDVTIEVPGDKLVFVDESLIRRVIVNLMHNAFKFTPIGGQVMIRLVEDASEQYVRIQIADTGPGIPENQRERIFGQFVQIEGNKPRTGGKGTGLGLNFCKLAVEAHGGRIWVEANGPLSGASFTFTVPIRDWRKS